MMETETRAAPAAVEGCEMLVAREDIVRNR
jgi:hypothetical protein